MTNAAAPPVLKGTLWESGAVPESRSQAFRLAEVLASQLLRKTRGAADGSRGGGA